MTTGGQHTVRSGGVDISTGGDVYIGGDVVGRDKITVVDATVMRWLALGATSFMDWLRLAGTAVVLGLVVAVLSRQVFGAESITDSAATSILHGAIGSIIGGIVAWYSPRLPPALVRVAWIEGGLVAAEWIASRLLPIAPRSVPAWFGLPILHASLLVSLIGGPWLALATFGLIRIAGPGRSRPINHLWWKEAIAIVGGCSVSGLLIVGTFGNYLNSAAPPVNPSLPSEMALSNIPTWTSGRVPPECTTEPGYSYYLCPQSARYDSHSEGFIVLPGWLSLSQAVAILLSLAMIIPVSAALLVQTQGQPPLLRRPVVAVLASFAVSAAIGVGLDSIAGNVYGGQTVSREILSPYEQWLYGPLPVALLWGTLGMASGLAASVLYTLMRRVFLKTP